MESRKKRDSFKTNYISEKSQLCSAAMYQGRGMTLLDYKRRLRENINFVFFWGTIAVFFKFYIEIDNTERLMCGTSELIRNERSKSVESSKVGILSCSGLGFFTISMLDSGQ